MCFGRRCSGQRRPSSCSTITLLRCFRTLHDSAEHGFQGVFPRKTASLAYHDGSRQCRELTGFCHPGATPESEDDMPNQQTTFTFTAEGIKAIKPETKRVDYWDANLTG